MNTIPVFRKEKFNGTAVNINETDFDSKIHRHKADGPWPSSSAIVATAEVEGIPLDTLTVAELRALAEERGIELKSSMSKTAIIEAIEQAE